MQDMLLLINIKFDIKSVRTKKELFHGIISTENCYFCDISRKREMTVYEKFIF